jgi:4'-phosphopantetheinyl transferase EntD
LAGLFENTGIVSRESSLCESDEPLYPEERILVSGWVEKRQREFAASRRCARKALAALGISDFPLLPGQDRAPIWPSNIVGAITHTDCSPSGYCGVAVANSSLTTGLGIDAEPRLPLPAELWPSILDQEEQREALLTGEPGIQARLVFSAKETTYKAIYPTLKQFLDFSDVHIQMRAEDGLFFANLIGPMSKTLAAREPLEGRLVVDDEMMVTAMMLPRKGLGILSP